jgi:hypothetical protein
LLAVKISRAAMKAAQEAAKAAKELCKGKKNNIFHSYLKASVVKLVLFLLSELVFHYQLHLSYPFQNWRTNNYFPHSCCPFAQSFVRQRKTKSFTTIGSILQRFHP